MPPLHGIYWLKRNAKTDRLLFIIKWVSYLLPVLIIATMVYGYFHLGLDHPETLSPAKQQKVETMRWAMALLALVIAGFPFFVATAFGIMHRHLGTDGHRIYVRTRDGTQTSFAPEQVVYGWREIRYKDFAIPVQTGHGQSLYADGELATYIGPLLPRAKKRGPLALLRYELAHPDRLMIVTAVYLGILFVLFVSSGLLDKVSWFKR